MRFDIQRDLNFKRFQNNDYKSKSNFLNSFHPNFLEFFQTEKDHQKVILNQFSHSLNVEIAFLLRREKHGRCSISLNKFCENESFEPFEPSWVSSDAEIKLGFHRQKVLMFYSLDIIRTDGKIVVHSYLIR